MALSCAWVPPAAKPMNVLNAYDRSKLRFCCLLMTSFLGRVSKITKAHFHRLNLHILLKSLEAAPLRLRFLPQSAS